MGKSYATLTLSNNKILKLFYVLSYIKREPFAPFFWNLNKLHFDANPITIEYLVTELS